MKRTMYLMVALLLLFLMIAFMLLFPLISCTTISPQADTESAAATEETHKRTKEPVIEPTEDPQVAIDYAKAVEYLQLLNLDSNSDFIVHDSFPIDNSEERSLLLQVNNISKEQFSEIEAFLVDTGFVLLSDPMIDEEKETRIVQYRNSEIYLEIMFAEKDSYFDVHFKPLVK